MVIDHINRNRLDNRLENLRMCTSAQNSYNRTKSSSSNTKYRGIKKSGKFWTASVTHNGETHTINKIESEVEAAETYNLLAENFFGEYAAKNIIT
jgi:hypothetical protein